jgi:hypothetical protein
MNSAVAAAPCDVARENARFAFSNSRLAASSLLLKALLQLLKQPLLHHRILCRAVFPEERVRQNARKR